MRERERERESDCREGKLKILERNILQKRDTTDPKAPGEILDRQERETERESREIVEKDTRNAR